MAAMTLAALAVAGLMLSIYALYVGEKAARARNYKPLCDVSRTISCTRAFTSRYSRMAGLPNAAYGILFYAAALMLALYSSYDYLFYLAIAGVTASVYLAYLSHIKLRTFCVVCSSTYAVNALLLLVSYMKIT